MNAAHRALRRLVLVGAGALLLASGPAAPLKAQEPSPAAIDAVFAEWDRPGSPGCALAVIRAGEVVYENGYGYANLDWDIPITPSTVFYAGSVSKQFTAAAVALLAREGRISLDDDIRVHFPEIPDYGAPVTIRHLIHHTSGIGDTYRLMRGAGVDVANVFSDAQTVALIASQPALDFEPGSEYRYSNGGYFLLSELVERVTGRPLREFTRDRLFEPLGMRDTHFHDRPGHVVARRAMSYAAAGDTAFVQTYMSNFDKVGAGGLYTTVRDLARWDAEFYDEAVGGPGFTGLLLTRGSLNDGTRLPYAFALRHGEHRAERTVGHSGSMMGFKAHLLRLPDRRLTVATLCNLGSIDPGALSHRVVDLYLDG
jgi:CubicO group peptidase (beta-lactamase class C family)